MSTVCLELRGHIDFKRHLGLDLAKDLLMSYVFTFHHNSRTVGIQSRPVLN